MLFKFSNRNSAADPSAASSQEDSERVSISHLSKELSEISKCGTATGFDSIQSVYAWGLNLGRVLEIASEASARIVEIRTKQRGIAAWFNESISLGSGSRPTVDYERFCADSKRHILAFQKLSSKDVDHINQIDALRLDGVGIDFADLPNESVEDTVHDPVKMLYVVLRLYDYSTDLQETLQVTQQFLNDYDSDSFPIDFSLAEIFHRRSPNELTAAVKLFERAVRQSELIIDVVPMALVMMTHSLLPSIAASLSQTDGEQLPDEQVYKFDQERLKATSQLSNQQLNLAIQESASRLSGLDGLLGEETAALLLSDDLDLALLRKPVAALRFALVELQKCTKELDLLTIEDFANSSLVPLSSKSLIKGERYVTIVNLISFLGRDVLQTAVEDLSQRKNLLQVTNSNREEIERALASITQAITLTATVYQDLHIYMREYRDRALMANLAKMVSATLRLEGGFGTR